MPTPADPETPTPDPSPAAKGPWDAVLVARSAVRATRDPDAAHANLRRFVGAQLGLEPGVIFHQINQGNDYFFVKSPYDTLNFPKEHPLADQPRYAWVDGPREGIRFGRLKADPAIRASKADGLDF